LWDHRPTVKDARNLEHIVKVSPSVAVMHDRRRHSFQPKLPWSAKWVDKVRINPGNYATQRNLSPLIHRRANAAELGPNRERFAPLVDSLQEAWNAMRVGRITARSAIDPDRYGDTRSNVGERARVRAIARDPDYHAFVFSMKSSNPK